MSLWIGWHCIYAMEHGAASVVGVDLSEKMLETARNKTPYEEVEYLKMPIEEIDFPPDSFDVVLSSLAFHYVESFSALVKRISACLAPGGNFVFSVEHPVFTAYGTQEWYRDAEGNKLHWPVDRYFAEGARDARFLGEDVVKYHKTLTTYLNTLLQAGLEIIGIAEPQPDERMLKDVPDMEEELRRPMMLIVSAQKKAEK